MTFVMMCAEMRVSIRLPVGDLSHFWPSETLADMERKQS